VPNTGLKKHGKDGAIYVEGVKVAAKAEWSLSLARDTVDVTSFGDTNRTYVVGLMDVSGTYAGFLDNSGDIMLTAAGEDAKFIELYSDDQRQQHRRRADQRQLPRAGQLDRPLARR
jgi:hypothetical protein